MSAPERRAMVERPGENLSVRRQCALLNLARSGVYRPGAVAGADDLALMRRIDELHLKCRFTARGEWCSNSTRQAATSTASACKG
jgi:putative transposase